MLKRLVSLLGGSSERVLRKLGPTVEAVNILEPEFELLSDNQFSQKTDEFTSRVLAGEELEALLPEAFAIVREAAKRTLNQRHFDVQLMGGIVLHQGKIAEMKTGEGKTLVSTLPVYLNSLRKEGVHVVTVNDYLARRDAQWMGSIYHLLGLSTGVLQHDAAYLYNPSQKGESGMEFLEPVGRREAYAADIVYGTNNEFGFDYLRDNMAVDLGQRVQRALSYAIVDEVDNVLIDEARTPLIISGAAEDSPKEYQHFARLVPNLKLDEDFTVEEKHRSVSLTGEGMSKLEGMLNVDNLYAPENFRLVHFAENALKARAIFHRDEEYVVKGGEVVIVDEFTGRLMPGRRYSDGLHQALEAKEGQPIQRESITYATITLQNYFRLYSKLSGMTGTAVTEAEEFWKIYNLDVVEISTNLPMVRNDRTDLIYRDQETKYKTVVQEIKQRHVVGQPVLVGTTDISQSELLSEMLTRESVPHSVLNAKQHEREAAIVGEAGRPGVVTVATNMAGRGTDIVLGGNPESFEITDVQWEADHKKVVGLGGLYIIGTERHEARRIDNQLRGRAGRQGDPGDSRFYVALDDELMRRFGGDRLKTVMSWAGLDDGIAIENRMVSKSIEGAQVKVEAHHFDMRKHLVEYDDVVNTHRAVIYGEREKVLTGADLKSNIKSMVGREMHDVVSRYATDKSPEKWDLDGMTGEIQTIFPLPVGMTDTVDLRHMAVDEIEDYFLRHADLLYEKQETILLPEVMRSIERDLMLRVIDSHWVYHLTGMENLRQGIGLHAFGQRDPLVMYKTEGHRLFQELLDRIQNDIVHAIFHFSATSHGNISSGKKDNRGRSVMANVMGTKPRVSVFPNKVGKVGRNDPCPCGSGSKYKRCHGVN